MRNRRPDRSTSSVTEGAEPGRRLVGAEPAGVLAVAGHRAVQREADGVEDAGLAGAGGAGEQEEARRRTARRSRRRRSRRTARTPSRRGGGAASAAPVAAETSMSASGSSAQASHASSSRADSSAEAGAPRSSARRSRARPRGRCGPRGAADDGRRRRRRPGRRPAPGRGGSGRAAAPSGRSGRTASVRVAWTQWSSAEASARVGEQRLEVAGEHRAAAAAPAPRRTRAGHAVAPEVDQPAALGVAGLGEGVGERGAAVAQGSPRTARPCRWPRAV